MPETRDIVVVGDRPLPSGNDHYFLNDFIAPLLLFLDSALPQNHQPMLPILKVRSMHWFRDAIMCEFMMLLAK